MKLLRLKITDPNCFRSLQAGFEYQFRSDWDFDADNQDFAPFVCAGPNGSGKSNLLEALAAIFYHLECIYLENLPETFLYDDLLNPGGFQGVKSSPDGFELSYQFERIGVSTTAAANTTDSSDRIRVFEIHISKAPGSMPAFSQIELETGEEQILTNRKQIREILPQYVLGYSSGENEILSLPFFKMRFVQFDEYYEALRKQLPYPGSPESRLVYLDSGFSQAILLCNLLMQDSLTLKPFREDVNIGELREFRIVIRRSIAIDEVDIAGFVPQEDKTVHPALTEIENGGESGRYRLNLLQLLDGDERSKIIPRLKRCATCWYVDEVSDRLYLDYRVDEVTKQAFRQNFDYEIRKSPIVLFEAFQVLLTLNLFSVSESLKAELYQSGSHYVSETVPTLAADERVMHFEFVKFSKTDLAETVMLKNLSDGEHQLLHTLGLCMLFKDTQSLYLLDEPETHFNPDWRANFITRLDETFSGTSQHEMLVTTHTPFLISDSKPEKVLVFSKDKETGRVSVSNPDYNTLGASINKITMATFGKRETIGLRAQTMIDDYRVRAAKAGEDKDELLAEINRQLGDSVEKVLLIKSILDSMEAQD